jgi:hypothetical protein
VFSLLLGLALVLITVSVPSDPATAGAWLTDSSRRATIALALNLVPFAAVFTMSTATITLRTAVIPRWTACSVSPSPSSCLSAWA